MNILGILSAFDWITPAIETVKEVSYTLESGEFSAPIRLDDSDIGLAERYLREAGIRVVSTTQAPLFQRNGFIDVPESQYNEAKRILAQHRIWCD